MAPIPHLTFEQFKSGFEFGLEVLGLSGALVTAWYRYDLLVSIWHVITGRASREEQAAARRGIEAGGEPARRAMDHLSQHLAQHNHPEMADRARGLTPQPQQLVDVGTQYELMPLAGASGQR